MDQMNISITDHLAGYVRAKVASGQYDDANEVVRDALLRMEEDDLLGAEASADELLSRLSSEQLADIEAKVLEGIEDLEAGRSTEYEGEEGLAQLAAAVKARGRELLKSRKAELAKAHG